MFSLFCFVSRLFLEKKPDNPDRRKMLPLKHQQAAFENIYLKAQEGMKLSVRSLSVATNQLIASMFPHLLDFLYVFLHVLFVQKSSSSDDQLDEMFNRKATLLKSLSVVLCCSPVCEKQSLFALFQSYKENNIEEQLIKKVTVSHCIHLQDVSTLYSLVQCTCPNHLTSKASDTCIFNLRIQKFLFKAINYRKNRVRWNVFVLLFFTDVVQCIQSAGLQECENVCQLSPVLLGSWVALAETVWRPLHSWIFPLHTPRPRHSQRFL